MQEAVVGAVVGATIQVVLQNLLSFPAEKIGLFINFKKDLKKLKQLLLMIQAFLEDAETKQVNNKAVQLWLMNLEDVAFNADYVFDLLSYQLLRNKAKKNKVSLFFSTSNPIVFRHKMAGKVKDIMNELKSINQEAKGLGLQNFLSARGANLPAYRETDSSSVDRVFVGRDNDARKIVEMVKNMPTERVLSVIPIVGMGGLGKTTLARKVFHDCNIISCFEKRIWVYVSENFVPETVFKKIYTSFTGRNVDGNREVVLTKLKEEIGDKRYLLVLDDVWNENRAEWDNFITSLRAISLLKGNVVLITTRKGNVASIANTNHIYELGVLSNEDCWCIIKAKAFEDDNISSEFKTIGANIAKKCRGLPLAAKVVGSLLWGKPIDEWRSIENKWLSDFGEDENNVMKILKLSFDNLPSSLVKKCFAFCSIIPKGWWMEKDEMIHMWMAEGLLQTDQEDMEILGNRVFNILMQCSMLQVKETDSCGNVLKFEMHDLVHDLASFILNPKSHGKAHQVRYISRPFTDEPSHISGEDVKCLRALFFCGKICHTIFSNLTRLHVLILVDGEMKELPVEIEKLICLRYLDISHTKMEFLPDSISKLYHLQTLRAVKEYGGYGCLRKLPHTLKFLTSLRHLCIPNIELPPEIGKLTKLQTLPYFKVRNEDGCRITELGSLKNLKGTIELHNLENVRDKEEAKTSDIFRKVNILKLKLSWNESREDDQNNDKDVLEGLQPHQKLESLIIEGFKGSSFPSWTLRMEVNVEDCRMRLDNLMEITLSNCRVCEEIPMMGHLPHLKALYLRRLSNVKCLGSSFYGIEEEGVNKETMMVVFPALEKLKLIEMESLSSWIEVELQRTESREVSIFPHLEYLKIYRCRQLKSAPSHFPCLKELVIGETESDIPLASICGSKLTSLLKLRIENVSGLVCLPEGLFSSNRDLLELEIWRCKNLSYLVRCLGGGGASLRKLEIWDCKDFEKFPDDLHKLNALEELIIIDCPNVKSIAYPSGTQLSSQGFTSLRRLEFHYCSGLTKLPLEMLESCDQTLEGLDLRGSLSLTNLPQVMSIMHKMSRLRKLNIAGVPKLGDLQKKIIAATPIDKFESEPMSITEIVTEESSDMPHAAISTVSSADPNSWSVSEYKSEQKFADEIAEEGEQGETEPTPSKAERSNEHEEGIIRPFSSQEEEHYSVDVENNNLRVKLDKLSHIQDYPSAPPLYRSPVTPMLDLTAHDLSELEEKSNYHYSVFLFLQRNNCLTSIPSSFFDSMPYLQYIDISDTKIRILPRSLFELSELKVLLLRNCICLEKLQREIKNLNNIEALDLLGTELYDLPDEIGQLTLLKSLKLSFYGPDDESEYEYLPSQLISPNFLSKLKELQALSISVHPEDHRWTEIAAQMVEDISKLEMLNYLEFYFPEVKMFEEFIEMSTSWKKKKKLSNFHFIVGQNVKRIVSRVPDEVESLFNQYKRCLRYVNDDKESPWIKTMLIHVEAFYLDHHTEVQSLSEFGITNLQALKFCIVRECPKIAAILDEKDGGSAFPCLEYMGIYFLWELNHIWKPQPKKIRRTPKPSENFKVLRYLIINTCPKLRFILWESMLCCLTNLEELTVEDCKRVERIIKAENKKVKHKDDILPRLRKLVLQYLPELVSVGNGVRLSEEKVTYKCNGCPKFVLNSEPPR